MCNIWTFPLCFGRSLVWSSAWFYAAPFGTAEKLFRFLPVPLSPSWTVSKPDVFDLIRLRKRVEELPWGSVGLGLETVVLFREQQLFLSFLLFALFDDDLHYMDCYCNCVNLYILSLLLNHYHKGELQCTSCFFFQTWSPLIVFSSDFQSELHLLTDVNKLSAASLINYFSCSFNAIYCELDQVFVLIDNGTYFCVLLVIVLCHIIKDTEWSWEVDWVNKVNKNCRFNFITFQVL